MDDAGVEGESAARAVARAASASALISGGGASKVLLKRSFGLGCGGGAANEGSNLYRRERKDEVPVVPIQQSCVSLRVLEPDDGSCLKVAQRVMKRTLSHCRERDWANNKKRDIFVMAGQRLCSSRECTGIN